MRSAAMHDMPLPESLLAVARAGAGVNNIPVPACSEQGIVVFNTPGANANAVMELVLAGLVLASRDVAGGIAWAKTLAGRGAMRQSRWKRAKAGLPGRSCWARRWAWWALGPSACAWPTWRRTWA